MPRTHRTSPRSDDRPEVGHRDGRHESEPTQANLRARALATADRALTQGGQAGIASGLAAIAYAILATTPEDPR